MKKIIVLVASLVVLYSVYHDLTVGVLPAISANSTVQQSSSLPYSLLYQRTQQYNKVRLSLSQKSQKRTICLQKK